MNALKPINRGFLTASIITVIGTLALAVTYIGNPAKGSIGHDGAEVTMSGIGWRVFGAVLIGLILAQVLSRLTEYFTGTEYGPVEEIAESAETGPATVVLSGTAVGSNRRCTRSSASPFRSAPHCGSAAATSCCLCISWRSAAWACSPPRA